MCICFIFIFIFYLIPCTVRQPMPRSRRVRGALNMPVDFSLFSFLGLAPIAFLCWDTQDFHTATHDGWPVSFHAGTVPSRATPIWRGNARVASRESLGNSCEQPWFGRNQGAQANDKHSLRGMRLKTTTATRLLVLMPPARPNPSHRPHFIIAPFMIELITEKGATLCIGMREA